MTFDYESAVEHLMRERPFRGSLWERYAEEVYEHGLNCEGVRQFETLDEAIDWWLEEYERSIHETALVMVGCEKGGL